MKIKHAVVVVTGASSGIGEATARAAADAGAKVVLLARRLDRVQAIAAELPDALAIECDVTDGDAVQHAVDAATEQYGGIDVLVNNAGQGLHVPIDAIRPADFRAVLELNLIAPLVVMQAVLPVMRQQHTGAIVNVSSGTTLAPIPNTAGYAASKAGLNRLTDIARRELEDDGIVVSTVLPFATRSEFHDVVRGDRHTNASSSSEVQPQEPEEVAAIILQVIETGEAKVDLVPKSMGGSYQPADH